MGLVSGELNICDVAPGHTFRRHYSVLEPEGDDGGGGVIIPDTFVFKQTKPDDSNTGYSPDLYPEIERTVVTGTTELNLTTPDVTYINYDFYRRVKRSANNLKFYNCRFFGMPFEEAMGSSLALIDCRPVNTGTYFERCDFIPTYPSASVDGIIGHDFITYRCKVKNTTDGIGVYRTQGPFPANSPLNVQILATYIDELVYWTGPTGVVHPSDNKTHNDCVQVQGGDGMQIIGSNLQGFLSTDPNLGTQDYSRIQSNAAIQYNSNVAGNPTTHTVIDYNWWDGGGYMINATLPGEIGTFNYNKFGRNSYVGGPSAPRTLVVGADSIYSQSNNTYEDNGAPITVRIG